jgi:uncharacterized protein YecE (DUF72 family)
VPEDRDSAHELRIGCSGWNYEHWRQGVFYPEGCPPARWLRHYGQFFDTVELNNTFYRLPRTTAVAHWVAETPPDFIFGVKVSRYMTHIKRLQDTPEHLPLLLERIEPLLESPKLGPLLWQLPPSLRRDEERLAGALDAFPENLRHAIEFRHRSWFDDDVMALLRERNVALVIADRPEIQSFQTDELTADFTYLRFHYGSRGLRGNYSDGELDEWAERVRAWSERGDVFAYFNNDWEGFAIRNALGLEMRLRLESAGAKRHNAGRPYAHRL